MNNNYSNTEKSLKRWLKTRVKVTMATVVGFLIAGNVVMGAEVTEPIEIKDQAEPQKMEIKDDINIIIKQDNSNEYNGIYINSGNFDDKKLVNEVDTSASNKININIENTDGYANGVYVKCGGDVKLGNENTEEIKINTISNTDATGIMAIKNTANLTNADIITGGQIILKGKYVDITSISKDGLAAGIWTQTNSNLSNEDLKDKIEAGNMKQSSVIIDADKTTITVSSNDNSKGIGIAAFSNSLVEIKGDLEIKQYDDEKTKENGIIALDTRGHSTIKINENGKNTVKIDGDIVFDRADTEVESNIILNLSNKNSVFNGAIYTVYDEKYAPKPNENNEDLKYSGMKIGISNGATWNVTGDSLVNDLVLDNGVINIQATEGTEESQNGETDDYIGVKDGKTVLNVDNIKGTGTVKFEAKVNGDEIEVAEASLRIKKEAEKNTKLEVGLSGVNADDLVKTDSIKETLEKLAGKVVNSDGNKVGNVTETYFAEEGKVSGAITAVAGKDGELVISQSEESKTVMGLKDLATINYLSWKQEMNSLSQRMGELRNSSAEHGVWARVYGGKVENGDQYDNEYQTYQVGYDKKYSVDGGNLYVGYLVSYTDGETNYELGHGENDSIGAGIYATWLNNNGHYVDVLYKVSRLNNKFDVGSTNDKVGRSTGDYDTMGISLSAEYGKRFDLTEKWFAEPSVGMHLGRLGDESYTTNGIEVSQDSIYTAEGRIGTAVGYKFTDKGNVYVRTHLVKEFAGEVDATYTADGLTRETSEDMGDSWFEFGSGVNYRFAENLNIYADIEKSGDSTVDTEWQGNLGFRYEF